MGNGFIENFINGILSGDIPRGWPLGLLFGFYQNWVWGYGPDWIFNF